MNTNETGAEVQADVVSAPANKTGKGTVIAAAAAVVIGGAGIACATVPAVRNAIRMAVMKPDDYCAYVYQRTFDRLDDQLTKRAEATEANTSDVTFEIELSENTAFSLKDIYGDGFCRKLTANGHVTAADGCTRSVFNIEADGRQVLDLDLAVGEEKGFFKIGKLTDGYVEYDIESKAANTAALASASLDADDISEIVRLYGDLIVEFAGDADTSLEKKVTGNVRSVAYNYSRITSVIEEEDIKAFYGKLADALENSAAAKKASGMDEEAYSEMLKGLRHPAGDVKGDAILCTYVDPNGDIRGVEWKKEDHPFSVMTAGFEDRFAFELESEGVSAAVTGRENGGRYTGKAVISTDAGGEDTVTVNFDDLSVINDKFLSGKVSCDMYELTNGSIGRLELLFEAEDDAQIISSELAGSGKFRASVKTDYVEGAQVSFPSESECIDMDTFLHTADFDKFISDLLASLGADEKYVSGGLFGGAMGLSDSF